MGKISEIFNFDDIGKKIKNLAKWSCWITILLIWIAAPIAFIALVADDWTAELCWIPLVSAVVGPVFVWIGSWAMYAFGEFVEDTKAIRYNTEIIIQSTNHNPVEETARNNKSEAKECPNHQPKDCTKNKAVNVPTENSVEDTTWVCGKCSTRNLLSNNACWRCGNQK